MQNKVQVPGCTDKFLTYYKSKQNMNAKVLHYSAYSPLNWIHLVQPATTLNI